MDETRILDLVFLHGCLRPTICILYEDSRRGRHLKTLCIDVRDKEFSPGPWIHNNVDHSANKLIPVSSPANGVILVSETNLSYIIGTGNIQCIEIQPAQVTCYSKITSDGSRYLLADHRGVLMSLVLIMSPSFDDGSAKVTSLVMDYIGVTNIAETMNYLDNGVVFIGGIFGDSQLIKLNPSDNQLGNNIEFLDSYVNIGPILDMCLVSNDKHGGQRQIVTCSGGYKDGSLRIIRSGVGMHEQVDIPPFS